MTKSREHPQIAEYFAHIRTDGPRGRADAGIAHVCPPQPLQAAPACNLNQHC